MGNAIGVYEPDTGVVYVHPKFVNTPTVLHEVSHAVTMKRSQAEHERLEEQAGYVLSHVGMFESDAKGKLTDLGLRMYSTESHEFLADAYMVRVRGSDEQWSKLADYTYKHGDKLDLKKLWGR